MPSTTAALAIRRDIYISYNVSSVLKVEDVFETESVYIVY